MDKRGRYLLFFVFCLLPFAFCLNLLFALSADQDRRSWRDYAGGPDSSRFSASTQINKRNVAGLKVAWTYPYSDTGFNPIVVHGAVYGRGRNGSLIALDAKTGEEIWIHDGLQGMTERGVNYWESKDGRD